MKAKSLLLGAASLLFGMFAQAQTPGEVMNLGVYFNVYKCTQTVVNGNYTGTCDQTLSTNYQNIAIDLSVCNDAGNGATFCAGSWNNTVNVDGINFMGYIVIEKSITSNGTSYSADVSLSDDSSDMFTNASLGFAGTAPTDSMSASGVYVASANDPSIGYASNLTIGPAVQSRVRTPAVIHPAIKRH